MRATVEDVYPWGFVGRSLSDKNIKAEPRTVHTVRGPALLTLARHTRQPPGISLIDRD